MRLVHHLLAQTPTTGSYALVAQKFGSLVYRTVKPFTTSVFLKFFAKWKKHPIISALGKEFEIIRKTRSQSHMKFNLDSNSP